MKFYRCFIFTLLALPSLPMFAQEDRVELDTTIIKGNTELPKILYVVPWKDLDGVSGTQQKLMLHSLFGDLFDPVSPTAPASSFTSTEAQKGNGKTGLELGPKK